MSLALLLPACATQPLLNLPEMSGWPARQATLQAADYWQFSGRVAVSANDEGFNGKLLWSQRNDKFRATVSGPLGIGTVRIEGDDRGVELTDNDGQVTRLQDAEQELQLRYGWTIPVESLRYWALGVPDPGRAADTEIADDGTLTALSQGSWQVNIEQYRDSAGQPMPRRITATNESTRVRLVIDRWVFY